QRVAAAQKNAVLLQDVDRFGDIWWLYAEEGRGSLLQLLVFRSNGRYRSQQGEETPAQRRLDEIANLPDQDVLELREDGLPELVMLVQQQGFDGTPGEKLPANHCDQGAVACRRRQTVGEVSMVLPESLTGEFLRLFTAQVADRPNSGHLSLFDPGAVQQGVEMIDALRARRQHGLEGWHPLLCQREQGRHVVTSAVGVVHDHDAGSRGEVVEAFLGYVQTFRQEVQLVCGVATLEPLGEGVEQLRLADAAASEEDGH